MPESTRMKSDGSVNVLEYRRALGAFMTGVTVVTTTDAEGRRRGMTMNPFTSVSLEPPIVLVCVDYRAASYDAFVNSQGFAVHILGGDQQELARTFASKAPDKFESVETVAGKVGAPLIRDVHAWLDCATENVIVAGDHAILLGKVLDYDSQDRRPLGFYQGKFNSFSTDEEIVQQQSEANTQTTVRWVVETSDERLALVTAEDDQLRLPESRLDAEQLSHRGLSAAASDKFDCDVEIDFLYSVYDGERGNPVLVYRGRTTGLLEGSGDSYTLIPATEVALDHFADDSEQAVIERYRSERVGAAFGIYAGSQAEGAIVNLAPPRPPANTDDGTVR